MAKLSGGQAVIESLLAQGVDTIFGIISVHTLDIYDALYDHRDAIRFISARHEHAAATMADGYARATGKPGICFTSTGPGAAYSMGGMGEAYAASSPVLHITSTAEEGLYTRGVGATHDTKDQLGMLNAVSQWACHVRRPEEVPDRIYEAFVRFQTQRPRPIAIEIPVDVQSQVAEMEIPVRAELSPPQGDPALVERAARALLAGKRVAIWAGSGVHRSGASEELVRLAETLGVPVLATQEGKGAIPEDHPLSLGMLGGLSPFLRPNPVQDPARAFLESLDTLLVVGSSLSYVKTKAVGLRMPPNLVHVDIDPDPMGKLYPASVGVVGDARMVLRQITAAVQGKTAQLAPGFRREVSEVKDKVSKYWWQFMPNQMRTMEAIRGVTARDAVFMGDASVSALRGSTYCLPATEQRTYFMPHWLGLGFAFPAAAGAKAGLPDRQVVCITGDGGFQFNIQEIGTCVQYGLNPVVLVFNDNAWGILKLRQRDLMKGRFIGTDLVNPDFVKLAESYGANGARVTSVKELVPALEAALKSDVITIIDVQTPNGFEKFR
ncbi:MAG: thiamine pyrophosphate-binding protein [Dehalococcoidia bacterium]|nr:thiamine pyrophosphate-binding protein [Dehalococcoidia bacterium]